MNLYTKLRLPILGVALFLLSLPLTAQNNKHQQNKNRQKVAAKSDTAVVEPVTPLASDSLQAIVDSLRGELETVNKRCDSLQQANDRAKQEFDSILDPYLTYVLNYSSILLYHRYNSRVETIADLMNTVPDEIKQREWEKMLTKAKALVKASDTSVDLGRRILTFVESVPRDETIAQDVRAVLSRVPKDKRQQYSLTDEAIALIDALPISISEGSRKNAYDHVRELLTAYQGANEEIRGTLQRIQEDPNNNIKISQSWQGYINQIKSTSYYKTYYGNSWNIPYLDNIIKEAIARLQNASKPVDFQDLIEKL